MTETFGMRFARLRKEKKLTQENIASKLNMSYQAISKWENDITSPDISILIELSKILGVSIDTLLGNEKLETKTEIKNPKDISGKMLIIVINNYKDSIKVSLPVVVIKLCLETGMKVPVSGNKNMENIDFQMIFDLIESGVIGELLKLEQQDGSTIIISVE